MWPLSQSGGADCSSLPWQPGWAVIRGHLNDETLPTQWLMPTSWRQSGNFTVSYFGAASRRFPGIRLRRDSTLRFSSPKLLCVRKTPWQVHPENTIAQVRTQLGPCHPKDLLRLTVGLCQPLRLCWAQFHVLHFQISCLISKDLRW